MIQHHATFSLPAPAHRAFAALVEQDQLARWFAEDVTIEPRKGGRFQFRGRGALGEAHGITAIEPGRMIAFAWSLYGIPTEVCLRITEGKDASSSTLEIDHTVRGTLPVRNGKHLIDDLWRHHHGNLAEHLRGGANIALPDLASGKGEVRVSIEIAARPAKVFRALLEPELMNRWLGGIAKVDLARREYSYGWSYTFEGRQVAGGPTRIVEIVENEKLVTDWTDWRGDPDKPLTRVTWLLEPLAGGTRTKVTIVHDGFEHPVDRGDYQQGWGEFADQLAKVAAEIA
jgi:uncharacterized protein YndB with AHSA1/START domain